MQPLHHAARGEHLDVVKLLLEAGACPKKENAYGQVPAEMADEDTEVRTLLTAKQVEASTHMSDWLTLRQSLVKICLKWLVIS